MMNKKIIIAIILTAFFFSCGKQFLEVRPNRRQVIPITVNDLQAVLDNSSGVMNVLSSHELGMIGADEYYITDEKWELLEDPYQQNGYIWAADVYEKRAVPDWNQAYRRILHANIVLEGIEGADAGVDVQKWNNVKGSALFFRAFNFYQLAQLFCLPYSTDNLNSPGIPLRLESDVTITTERSSVGETYDRIVADLIQSIDLLPDLPLFKTRPSKAATYALLSKTYLLMRKYELAIKYATLSLNLNHSLTDFSKLDNSLKNTFIADFGESNSEVIFFCSMFNTLILGITRFNMHQDVINLYQDDDLRKSAYLRIYTDGRILFKGSYSGAVQRFTGIATDEVWLIRAECFARTNNIPAALADLNELAKYRYADEAIRYNSNNEEQALSMVLLERRKELLLRGVRWEDLRRFNQEETRQTTITREIGGKTFMLVPGDKRYVWPIPDDVIAISGITQNER